jgi:hypothetical protein
MRCGLGIPAMCGDRVVVWRLCLEVDKRVGSARGADVRHMGPGP